MYIERWVRVFSKPDGAFVTEIQFSRFSLPDFQKKFAVAPDIPMYDSYPVLPDSAEFVQGYLRDKVDWDFERYSYFLEADISC